jgi:hypothetical protein
MAVELLPHAEHDTDPGEDPRDPESIYARVAHLEEAVGRVEVSVARVEASVARVEASVGPVAQRHRARRESALVVGLVGAGACLGLGALGVVSGASPDVTIALVAGVALATVVTVASIIGRGAVKASVAGASIEAGAGSDTGDSAP